MNIETLHSLDLFLSLSEVSSNNFWPHKEGGGTSPGGINNLTASSHFVSATCACTFSTYHHWDQQKLNQEGISTYLPLDRWRFQLGNHLPITEPSSLLKSSYLHLPLIWEAMLGNELASGWWKLNRIYYVHVHALICLSYQIPGTVRERKEGDTFIKFTLNFPENIFDVIAASTYKSTDIIISQHFILPEKYVFAIAIQLKMLPGYPRMENYGTYTFMMTLKRSRKGRYNSA